MSCFSKTQIYSIYCHRGVKKLETFYNQRVFTQALFSFPHIWPITVWKEWECWMFTVGKLQKSPDTAPAPIRCWKGVRGAGSRKPINHLTIEYTIMVYSTGWKGLQHKLWNGNPWHGVNLYWIRKVSGSTEQDMKSAKLVFQADWVYEERLNMWRMWNWVTDNGSACSVLTGKERLAVSCVIPSPRAEAQWVSETLLGNEAVTGKLLPPIYWQ